MAHLPTMVYQFSKKNWKAKWKRSSKKSWRSCSWGSKSNLNFQLVKKPSWSSPHEVIQSQSWLINSTVYHLSVSNIKGRGLKREGGFINFLLLKRGEGLLERRGLFERGGLIEDYGKPISCWSPKKNNQTWSSTRKPNTNLARSCCGIRCCSFHR